MKTFLIFVFFIGYPIVAFFLKSEYPLKNHDLNVEETYVVLKDYFTIICPFVIAYIAYSVWHGQKGSEVLANETKDLLKNVLEEASLISMFRYETQNGYQTIIDKLERQNVISQANFRYSLYLQSCMGDEELIKLLKKYTESSNKLYIAFKKCEINSVQNALTFKTLVGKKTTEFEEYSTAMEAILTKLSPYSTFQKTYNLKSFK